MEISRKPPTGTGPAETFTGEIWVDPITRGLPPSQLNVNAVHFTPGARTAWHSDDGGQTLYVTEGRGRIQARGQEIVETHLSITEGGPHWGPHVTDAEYHG